MCRNIWLVTLLDEGEVSRLLAEVVTSGKENVIGATCNGETCHGTQVVKMHNQNEIFCLIVVFEVDRSPEVDG